MVGVMLLYLHILLVVFSIFTANNAGTANEKITTCKTNRGQTISGWDWEVINNKNNETYFINFCDTAKHCDKGVSVCKKSRNNEKTENYGVSVKKGTPIYTFSYGKDFSILFNGTGTVNSKHGCKNTTTMVNFLCDKTLGSPELVDDNGCMATFEFFTKEACKKAPDAKIAEIPCVIYNPADKQKRDLSPLIKLSGGHRVSSSKLGVSVYINVCRDIKFDSTIPEHTCHNDKGISSGSPACRKDLKKPIGKITTTSKLIYDGDKIKLVYKYPPKAKAANLVTTEITFLCQKQFSNGGTGPVLLTEVEEKKKSSKYEITWRTGHACPNNDVITEKCKFTNGEVSFDLTKLEKPNKRLSYQVKHGENEYRIKVCSNGQPCGDDSEGSSTAVCQITKGGKAYSCGNAKNRTIRYADDVLTMVYKGGSPCHSGVPRRTIITFRCDPTKDVGEPKFIEEQHCYYYFDWQTKHVCPSRKPGSCSVISEKGQTYDLSILTKSNSSWLAINDRKSATGYTYYINVCGSIVNPHYKECEETAACEVKKDGAIRGIGMYKSLPTISTSGTLSLTYIGGDCNGYGRNITTTIKFVCKNKDLESPPELESRSWDGCDYMFTWSTAAACPLRIITGKGCVLEDYVTGNVYSLKRLGEGPGTQDYFSVPGKSSKDDEFYIKICSKSGLKRKLCGNKHDKAGVCRKTKDTYSLAGETSDKLYYYDGVLKLTFSNGDDCGKRKRESHITFFCDEKAGTGKPVFVSETKCVYNFVWYTVHSCPLKTMECVTRDSVTGKEYDLSPLVKKYVNWKTEDDKGNTYYISVCRVLHRNTSLPDECPVTSSACVKYKNGTVVGIGDILKQGLSVNNGVVSLQYKSKKAQTLITFTCNEGEESSPKLTKSYTGRQDVFLFHWETKEACAVKPRTEEGCQDKDSRISLLTKSGKQGYTVEGPRKGKIRFNVCQSVTCGDSKTAAACLESTDKKTTSIGDFRNSSVEHSGDDVITLIYSNGDWISRKSWALHAKTKINFICDRNIVDRVGKYTFVAQEENVYVIEFRTFVICKTTPVQCQAFSSKDNSKHYDLKPLSLTAGNWMAADTRSHLDYYINVCHEYYPGVSKYKCMGAGGIGGCQVDNISRRTYNMGYVQGSPTVSSEGDVTLLYLWGDICHSKYKRSTRINFFCSDIHGSPVYMIETEGCEYVFNWKTPAACPLKKYKGKNCAVYDEKYGVYYDLTPLTLYSHSIGGGVSYSVRFCGPKVDDPCGRGYNSCLLKDKKATASFKLANMTFYDDTIKITHVSDNKSITIVNEISCDVRQDALNYETSTKTDNGYHIFWSTKLACRPVRGEECSLTTERDLYDLSVLAKEKWNWLAKNDVEEFGFKGYQFYFSVCKPLKNIAGLRNKGSRAAMQDNEGKVTSLGTMSAPLKRSHGYLTMTYGHGDKIPSQCDNVTTIIQFVCDNVVPDGVGVGPVVDGFDKSLCQFHVTWLTRAACPVRSLMKDSSPVPCTAIHPATKKSIDLSALQSKSNYKASDQDGNKYLLNICGTAKGCPKNSAICRKDGNYTSMGNVSTALMYRQGFLYLHYKNGDKCPTQKDRNSETLITFMCDLTAGTGKPTVEKTKDCTHFVTWKTKLTCEAEVDCVAVSGNKFYDLSSLIKNDANYELHYQGRIYLMNLCRSLVRDSRCEYSNAAVCALPYGEYPTKDLGHVENPPKIFSSGQQSEVKAQLIYNTTTCSNPTTINFVCDPHEHADKPRIVYADECSVKMTWWTSLVCDKQPIKNHNCTFSDVDRTFCFDLNRLTSQPSKLVEIRGSPGGSAHFHVCGNDPGTKECKEAKGEACLMLKGKIPQVLTRSYISYNGQEVRILYGNDAVLLLYCGKDENSNTPQYLGQHEEHDGVKYFFSMITPEVCPPRVLPCEIRHKEKVYNLAGLSEKGGYRVKHGDDVYWVSICGHIQFNEDTRICSSRATAIKASTTGKPQIIATDKNHSLTYNANDDYPIHLQYFSDQTLKGVCNGDKKPTVKHKLKCKDVMKAPRFDSLDKENCILTFIWETSEACAEKRTPLSQKGDVWVFSDSKTFGCELDLTILKAKLSSRSELKDCTLSKDVEVYAEGEDYELVVNCTIQNSQKRRTIDVFITCANESEPETIGKSTTHISLLWETTRVCDVVRSGSCSKTASRVGATSAMIVIGTLAGIGLLAAILFFVCKPEKRATTTLWLKWHVRKYICCKPSYQASYHYRKVRTDEEGGETDFITEAGAGTLFSDSEDDDNHNSDHDKTDDDDNKSDDELLPLDDELLDLLSLE